MVELLHKDLTKQIIGAYYEVYNALSQTYPEHLYENAMLHVLRREWGIPCSRQDEYQVVYKDKIVGLQRLDMFVAGEVVVELKVAQRIEPVHLAQLLSYVRVAGKEVGLLFRFGGPEPEFARRVLTIRSWEQSIHVGPPEPLELPDLLHPDLVYDVVGGLFEVFRHLGPGFLYRIYANACFHEMRLRGLAVKPHRSMEVFLHAVSIGTLNFAHLQVEDQLLVFPVAILDIANIRQENLKAWMRTLNIPLGILANFHATRLQPVILRA